MFKKTVLSLSCAAALAAGVAPAFAASSFFLVVPIPTAAKAPEESAITVSLAGATLPKAKLGKAYSESLRTYLSVTGDATFDPSVASWHLANGSLPAGLALGVDGTITGTPSALTSDSGSSFEVVATYKSKSGQQVYTIRVGSAVLNAVQISMGHNHACAVTTEGAAKCWGSNASGQLGDGTNGFRSLTPVQVVGLESGVTAISAGAMTAYSHTCAIQAGALKCWGQNAQGQLGDGTTTDRRTPAVVSGLGSGVTAVSTGYTTNCALQSGGVKCWGINEYGQVGDGTNENRTIPVAVAGMGSGVTYLASAGGTHNCAIQAGALKCWGRNSYGQLGDGTNTHRNTPVGVIGLGSGVISVVGGTSHTCSLQTFQNSGQGVLCWGANSVGQLGDAFMVDTAYEPTPVIGLTAGVTALSGTANHNCAIQAGALKCWGSNSSGQLGDGSTVNSATPRAVPGLSSGVTAVAAGHASTCVLQNSEAKCWGANNWGQLGTGYITTSMVPVNVAE